MRILFITSNRLGDAVLTTGLLGHLMETSPAARFTIVAGPLAAPLFRALPGLETLIALPKRRWSRHWLDLWRRVVATRWDLVLDVRDTPVSRLIRARRRAVLRTPDRGEHKVATLARAYGLAVAPSPRLWLDAEASNAAARLLPGNGPYLALAPAANWTGKEWPAERYAELAAALTAPEGPLAGAAIVLLGAAGEEARCRPVGEQLHTARIVDLVGRTDPQLAAACIARCQLFVGNDSGLMHVAAAAGTPTLGLFGPSPAETYGPWGARARAVVAPGNGDGTERLRRLPVATVLQAARELLGAPVARQPA